MKSFCIIPAWNESKNIIKTLNDLKESRVVDEIVVVNDGSSDDTLEILNQQIGITVINLSINRGQGAALRAGTNYALIKGSDDDVVIHFDADGQFRVEDIERALEPLRRGECDVVFGSRFMDNTTKMPKFKKRVIMPLARLVNRFFLDVNMTDPQSGFRLFTVKAGKKFTWHQDRMAHCSEILYAVTRAGLNIKEVPITVIYHHFGQKFSGGIEILKNLFFGKLIN